jgi:fibronectin type 3 domain-containing protein
VDNGGVPLTAYFVYKGEAPGKEVPLGSIGLATSYTDLLVTNGRIYYYKVTAFNALGESPQSNEASASPHPAATPPGSPRGLGASGGDSVVTLGWSAPSSDGGSAITNYRVYRRTPPTGFSSPTTVGNVYSYTDNAVANGVTYNYVVRAVNGVGEGGPSNEASATPTGPRLPDAVQNLGAKPGKGSIGLTWSPPGSNGGSPITGYNVYRGLSSGDRSVSLHVGVVTSYTDTGLTVGQIYYYVVRALNALGEGPPSNEVSAAPANPPDPPRNLRATAGNGAVTIQWNDPLSDGGAVITNYKIYRGTTAGGESLVTTVGNVNTFTDTGLSNGQPYFYRVSAVNDAGEGSLSNEVSAAPSSGQTVPSTPQNLEATAGNGKVMLAWSVPASDGGSPVLSYTVRRGLIADDMSILVEGVSSLSLLDSAITNGVTYEYAVSATNAIGEGPRSNPVAATPKGSGSGGDSTKPTITISSPQDGAMISPGSTFVSGTASDDVGVAWVEISPDGTNWTLASGKTSWNARVNLALGTRTIYARATDLAGNNETMSVTVTVTSRGDPGIAGGDLPKSILATAILSFAAAAGVAWFLIGRRRGASLVEHRRPEDAGSASAAAILIKKPVRRSLPPIIMGRWKK